MEVALMRTVMVNEPSGFGVGHESGNTRAQVAVRIELKKKNTAEKQNSKQKTANSNQTNEACP